jgi:DnaJ family protein C protein 25
LKDDETRNDYNYMLDNPDAHYYNYYQYYRRRVTPKVDVRIVIAGTILIISLIQVYQLLLFNFYQFVQYISAHHKFNEAVGYLMTQPKYRIRAMEIAKERGLLDDDNTKTKGRRKKDKVCCQKLASYT